MATCSFGTEVLRVTKKVYYEGTSTLYEGMPVCYNYDSTSNILGVDPYTNTASTTTTEGYQNEGKFLRVENVSSTNQQFFAGVVVGNSWDTVSTVGPCWLDIFVPNGAMVPVRSTANCTLGSTILGLSSGVQGLAATTDLGSILPVAIAMETVDRSSTNGLVLAKLTGSAGVLTAMNASFAPTRALTTGDAAGVRINISNLLTSAGTGGPRTWGLYITGDKTSGEVSVAGCDDAGIRVNISCRTVNTSVYTFRGLNCAVTNGNSSGSDPGTVGTLENLISTATKSGSTTTTQIGLEIVCENYGTVSDTFGGLKIDLRNEGAAATAEYGIRVTNTNNSVAGAVNAVIQVDETGANTGFTNFLYVPTAADLGVIAASGDITFTTSDKLIPIKVGSTTYYLVATDNV